MIFYSPDDLAAVPLQRVLDEAQDGEYRYSDTLDRMDDVWPAAGNAVDVVVKHVLDGTIVVDNPILLTPIGRLVQLVNDGVIA